MAILESIHVGLPKTYGEGDASWTSAIAKHKVHGAVQLGRLNLDGDRQADLTNHGGEDRPVLMYGGVHYAAWPAIVGRELGPGAFGENLVVSDWTEETVCIGDRFAVGPCLLEVSQPRLPCWKLAKLWDIDHLDRLVSENGWSGWYCRTLREGSLTAGVEVVRESNPHPEWPVKRAFQLMLFGKEDIDGARSLAALEALSALWRVKLKKRLADA